MISIQEINTKIWDHSLTPQERCGAINDTELLVLIEYYVNLCELTDALDEPYNNVKKIFRARLDILKTFALMKKLMS
jgi:hypothetical protein